MFSKLDNLIQGKTRCYIGLVVTLIDNFFFGAILYGFSTLIPIYVKMKVFNYLCGPDEADCLNQYKAYGNAYIIWTIIMMVSVLPNGFVLDKVSIKVAKGINVLCTLLGSLLQAFIFEETSNIYYVGGIFTGIGAITGLMTSITISNFFPSNPGLVIGLVAGAWDSSTAILPIFAKAYENGIPLRTSYLILAAFGFLSGTFLTLFIYSNKQTEMVGHARLMVDTTQKLASDDENISTAILPKEKSQQMLIAEYKLRRYPTLMKAILSGPFMFNLVFYVIGYLRFSLFFALIPNVVEKNMSADKNELLTNLSYFLISGILFAPITGIFYDACTKYVTKRLDRMVVQQTTNCIGEKLYFNSILNCLPGICIVIAATFIYSGCIFSPIKAGIYMSYFFLFIKREFFFVNNSIFIRTTFRSDHFGTLYGLTNMIAGIVSLVNLGLQELEPDMANYVAVGFVFLLIALPSYMVTRAKFA